jgi:mannose-1-phosphate guanylyltransferase
MRESNEDMSTYAQSHDGVWSIVLAGAQEHGVRPFIQRWLGRPKPKQYCTFVGTRSLFQHTLDRADQLTAADQKVIVLSQSHAWEAWPQLGQRPSGTVILQPADRGTAAGIFHPLTYIKARDPRATVVIYPPDHFVYPEHRFLDSVQRAIWTVERFPDRLVLLGIVPDRLELDYGWIEPGEELHRSSNYQIRAVRTFLVKPTAAEADAALSAGALWNTLVVVAKVETLWSLGWHCFPDLIVHFERLGAAIGTSYETRTIKAMYGQMLSHNFASALLRRVPDRMAVVEMDGVLWSDWSKPERIANVLRQIGRQPAFPLACLHRPFAPLASASPGVVS